MFQKLSTCEKPLEYITGFADFYKRRFIVSQDILIPRIETEEIIKIVLDHYQPEKEYIIADVGTGSGCIGITLALELPNSKIYLSDISPKALKIASKNAHKHLTSFPPIFLSNLLSDYPSDLLFDVIVANLPYIPTTRIPKLPKSVRNFEPKIALDGGPDGLKLINKLITQLPLHLKPNGLAILEIDDTHKKFFPNYEVKKDQFGRDRFLIFKKTLNC